MKLKAPILILTLLFSLISYCQTIQEININDIQYNKAKFIGEEDALQRFFAMNLRYPMDLNYGTLIGIIIIDQKANTIKTLTLNPPGKSYQKEFERIAQMTIDKWEKVDSINTLYCTLTIDFSFMSKNYFIDFQNQPKFISANVVVKNYDSKKLKSDESLIETLNESYAQKDYKKVENITKELIKRNPFTESIYVMRIKALNELGMDASEEFWILTEFLNKKNYSNILKK